MARRVRVAHAPLVEGDAELGKDEARYLGRVHRLAVGDRFVAFDPERAEEADATIVALSKSSLRCRLGPRRPAERVPGASITLVQALGKASKPDRVIREATTLGAGAIFLVRTERVVVQPKGHDTERLARYGRIATDAARQSQRGDLPVIAGPMPLEQAFGRLEPDGLRCCLSPDAPETLFRALEVRSPSVPVILLIGPEGGFTDEELGLAVSSGFVRVRLGRFILRTETAAAAALGVVASRW